MTSKKWALSFSTLILLSVGALTSCAGFTTPRACRSVCEVQDSEPCKKCIADDDARREEERRKRAEERRQSPTSAPPSAPSGGGGGMGY